MGWACGVYGWGEGAYRVLVGKPEGKRPLGRPRSRWVDNIRLDLQEVGCGYMDWIGLAQHRERWRTLVNAVMNIRVPWNAGNFLTSCKPVSFSRRTLHHAVSIAVPCKTPVSFTLRMSQPVWLYNFRQQNEQIRARNYRVLVCLELRPSSGGRCLYTKFRDGAMLHNFL